MEWSGGKETLLGNTRLITNYVREFQSASGWPSLRKCKLSDINEPLYVIERIKENDPVPKQTVSLAERRKYVVSVCLHRGNGPRNFTTGQKRLHVLRESERQKM